MILLIPQFWPLKQLEVAAAMVAAMVVAVVTKDSACNACIGIATGLVICETGATTCMDDHLMLPMLPTHMQ